MKTHEKLREIRLHFGLTPKQMGAIIFLCREAYRKIEAGTTQPDVDKLRKIAKHFGLSLQALIDEEYCIIVKQYKGKQYQIHFYKQFTPDTIPGVLDIMQDAEKALQQLKDIHGIK